MLVERDGGVELAAHLRLEGVLEQFRRSLEPFFRLHAFIITGSALGPDAVSGCI